LHPQDFSQKVYAVSLGYPKNLVDTEIMLGLLTECGWEVTPAPEVDGQVYITAGQGRVGEVRIVPLTQALPYDLVGEIGEG
jgi:hypothetical protein